MKTLTKETREIAQKFASILRDWLTQEEMTIVVDRNKRREKGVCHTHDFCDANMAMQEAIETTTGKDDSPEWDTAWNFARENEFWHKP
jgi:hypothetical protein